MNMDIDDDDGNRDNYINLFDHPLLAVDFDLLRMDQYEIVASDDPQVAEFQAAVLEGSNRILRELGINPNEEEVRIERNNEHNQLLRELGIDPDEEDEEEEFPTDLTFDDVCRMLQDNDPNRMTSIIGRGEMEFPRHKVWNWAVNDATYTSLGEALVGTTALNDLTIEESNAPDLTSQGVMALANGISRSQLKHLRFSNVRLDFQDILFEHGILKSSSTVTALSVYDTIHVPRAMEQLFRSPSAPSRLSALNIVTCPLTCSDLTCLMQGLRGNEYIQKLRLIHCGIGDKEVTALCQSWNDDSGIVELKFTSQDFWSLSKKQDITFNTFGPAGVRALMRAVARQPSMRSLAFNVNSNYDGITSMGEELPQVKLHELEFNFGVEPNRHQRLEESPNNRKARDKAGRALIEGVKGNVHLIKFDACYRGVEYHVQKEIAFYLELNHWGRRLLPNDISDALWCHVLATFRENPSRMFYFLREQPYLTMSPTMRN